MKQSGHPLRMRVTAAIEAFLAACEEKGQTEFSTSEVKGVRPESVRNRLSGVYGLRPLRAENWSGGSLRYFWSVAEAKTALKSHARESRAEL